MAKGKKTFGKPFPGTASKDPYAGQIGGSGNGKSPKSYGKGKGKGK